MSLFQLPQVGQRLFQFAILFGALFTLLTSLMLYLEDVDAAIARAVAAGARVTEPVKDQFYGDRNGQVVDPFGHSWTLSTHVENVPPDEMKMRIAKLFG